MIRILYYRKSYSSDKNCVREIQFSKPERTTLKHQN